MTSLNTNTQAEITTTFAEGGAASSGRRSVYDIITERICAQLEKGVVPWHKPWRGGDLGSPRNFKSGQAYRGINVFLLSCAPYSSPYWLTYRQAVERGGMVKKGEHGFPVVFWKWLERIEKDEQGREHTRHLPLLRYYTVFNVEQCDDIETPVPASVTSDFQPIEHCDAVVAGMPQAPAITHNDGRAFYRPSTDAVSIPRPQLFTDPAEYYGTLFHELGHASGHASRLDRPGITESHYFGDCDYSKEELVAEMASAFLCGHCGIESTTLDNSAAYIGGWLKKLRDDRRLVVTAGAQAQKAADFILGRKAEQAEPAVETV
jgi:antirestriction protein ArdC